MRGLKFIPYFLVFAIISFIGVLFVQVNDQKVSVNFGRFATPELPLGFVVICAVLVGMIVIGLVSILEFTLLAMQNRNLKKKVAKFEAPPKKSTKLLPSWESKWPKKESKPEPVKSTTVAANGSKTSEGQLDLKIPKPDPIPTTAPSANDKDTSKTPS